MKKQNSGNFVIVSFFILFILYIFLSSFSCVKNSENNPIDNPELQIAKEINTRQIVMLGEASHSHPSGYKEVIKILYEWLGECKTHQIKSATLNFVWEIDEYLAGQLNQYLVTGDFEPILDSSVTSLSFETSEFISNLKTFNDSLRSFNEKNSGFNINFKILGFEQESNISLSPEFAKKTNYEIQYWFVKVRDSLVSQNFINYFNNNKNKKYLFYYGLSHLQKNYINKKMPGYSLSEDSCYGYFLAGYLKKDLGETNVLTIAKEMIPPQSLKRIGLDSLIDKYYLVESQNMKILNNSKEVDYFFLNPFIDLPNHFFIYVYSKKVFEKALEKITLFKKYPAGSWTTDLGKKTLKQLSYLAGVNFKDVNGFKVWFNNQNSFDLNHFDSKEYKEYLFNTFSNEENSRSILKQLGFDNNLDEYRTLDSNIWNNKIMPEAVKNIKFINAIGIYWAGYPDEKIKAKKFLKTFSGEDFNEPEKYLQWWRNVYHNYGI